MKYQYAIFIGRFSPYHLGHMAIMEQALKLAEKVIVIIGSYNRSVNIKNPWTGEERRDMIRATLSESDQKRVDFLFMKDYLYNDNLWIQTLQNKIADLTDRSSQVVLVGSDSDSSSYYLDLFKNWRFCSCITNIEFHAADIRREIFSNTELWKDKVHSTVLSSLTTWIKDETVTSQHPRSFAELRNEYEALLEYSKEYKESPPKYLPIYVTVDAVVIKSGHILLVNRGGRYGHRQLALPGGFLGPKETIINGMLRELKEESAIRVGKEELRKYIKDSKVFDHPERSLRIGRTITHAFMIDLGSGELPKVKGGDDAMKAVWIPLNEVFQRENEFFEDHCYIIQHFVMKG